MPIDGVVASGGMKYTIVTPIGFIPLSTDASNITVLSSGSTDDGYFTVDLPFTTYFNGIGYNQYLLSFLHHPHQIHLLIKLWWVPQIDHQMESII